MRLRHSCRGRVEGARNSSISAYAPELSATRPMCTGSSACLRISSALSREKAALACFRTVSIMWSLGTLRSVEAKHDVQPLTPFYRQADALHLNSRCEKAQ